MRSLNGLSWAMVLILGLTAGTVEGAADRDLVTMAPVAVTARRSEGEIRKVPANVTVIDQEDIERSTAKNVADLLRSEEGIVVRDLLGNGKTAQVDMRGFGETGPYNNLVMVDGRRVNEIDLSGVDWLQIPLELVERIEIVRGTGTVLYGDNASGGVINIITKRPVENFQAQGGAQIGSYDSHAERLSLSGKHGNLGASLFATYEETDGYRDNNELRAKNLGGKIILDPAEFLRFNLSGAYHKDDYGLPSSLTEDEMEDDRKQSTAPYDDAETKDRYVNLNVDMDFGVYGGIVTDFSYRTRDSDDDFVQYMFSSERDTDTYGVTPRYLWDGEIMGHENVLVAGADFYWTEQDVDSYFGDPLAPSSKSQVERDTMGVYFRNEFSLLEDLVLSFGARYERSEYDLKQKDLSAEFPLAPLDDSMDESEPAYSAGLTFLYGDGSSVFVRANRSFRFPLTDELIVFDYIAGEISVNQDLKPQTGNHYEGGIRHFFTPDIQGSVTLFWADMDDEIFYNPVDFSNENHPETLHRGVEMGSKANLLGWLTLFGNYTYIKATFEDDPFDNKDVPAVPRHRGNLGFSIHDLVPGLVFSGNYNYVGSSYAISDQENDYEKLDDYYTVDAKLSYTWKMLKAYVGANNLTDQEYSEYAAVVGFPTALKYLPAPERNWFGGVEVTF